MESLLISIMPRLVLGLGSLCLVSVAMADRYSGRDVFLPVTFHAEAHSFSTSMCLKVVERKYPKSAWWKNTGDGDGPVDEAFASLIAAIERADRDALLSMTHASQSGDAERFEHQASAYIQQFAALELVEVPKAYQFDGLTVFFAGFRYEGKTQYAPLIFTSVGTNSFRFLPERTRKTTFQFVADWFNATWQAGELDKPRYCRNRDVRRANYAVTLESASWKPSQLLIAGSLIEGSGKYAKTFERVGSVIEQMNAALRGDDITTFAKYLTPEGAGRLLEWYWSAEQGDRDVYKQAVLEQQPFFVFDASPLLAVYTRSESGSIQVMYFTPNADDEWLWTNSSHVTSMDAVFKKGTLHNSARSAPPFSVFARN